MTDWLEYYRKTWTARGVVFDRFLAEESNLARVLGRYDRFEASHNMMVVNGQAIYQKPTDNPTAIDRLECFEPGVTCGTEAPVSYYTGFETARLLADLAVGADVVAEIGTGYGRQLFDLWLAGGGTRQTRFVGFEPNEAGRDIANRLAGLVPDMNVEFRPGDFLDFDESALSCSGRILIFTNFAVMYQAEFPAEFFLKLSRIPGEVVLACVEPLGWQFGGGRPLEAEGHNLDFIHKLGTAAEEGLIQLVYLGRNLFGRESSYTQASVIVAIKPAAAEAGGPSG